MKLGNRAISYISADELSGIYSRLSEAFPGAVIIGGRAVNIHCGRETRGTHDIDVVVGPIRNITEIKKTLEANEFLVVVEAGTIKKLIDIKRGGSGIAIDIYTKEGVGGVGVGEILRTSEPVQLRPGCDVLVANKALLIFMKYSAGRHQDITDIISLVGSCGGVDAFLAKNSERIAAQFPGMAERESFEFAIKGIFYGASHYGSEEAGTPNPRAYRRGDGRWGKARRGMRRRHASMQMPSP